MNKKIFVFIIFLLGTFLRFYQLGQVPAGFHRDEAFLGYNAYSLLKTGRDMSGAFLPLHFESFIFSPGGYSYFAIFPIALFGLNEFSVRFPAAFLGSLTIIVVFFLTKKLFPKTDSIALFASFFLAITPWHINLSRTSAESTLVVFFIALGVYLFHFPFFSFLSFLVTLTLYQAPRAFLPLFVPFLIGSFKKKIGISLIFYFILIIVPVIAILLTPTLATRMRTVGLWSTEETKLITQEQIREDGIRGIPPILSRAVHNKFIGYSEAFLKNYFQHLSYNFLFTDSGLPDRYRVPNAGLLFLSMLPLIILGFVHVFNTYPRQGFLLTVWIFLSIVGSALTFDDVPNLQRTLLVFPALAIIIGIGAHTLLKPKKKLILVLLFIVMSFEGYRYLHHYYVQQLVHRPWYRQEGYRNLVKEFEQLKPNYKQFVITNRESAPAIFFLFYTKYDPKKFQEETKNSEFRDFDRINFANYTFSIDECPFKEVTYTDPTTQAIKTECFSNPQTLYANSGLCPTPKVCANVLQTIKRNDGTAVFMILDQAASAASLSGTKKD